MIDPREAKGVFDSDEVRASLERLLNFEPVRKSPSLRHLLEYLVAHSAAGNHDRVKESIIGVEVFGRQQNFDCRVDNIVRVQAHRLRKLLDLYYSDAGKSEAVRFLIPKGTYVTQIQCHPESLPSEPPPVEPAEPAVILEAPALPETPRARRRSRGPAIGFAAGVAATLLGLWLTRLPQQPGNSPTGLMASSVANLWKSILEPGNETILSFTNPAFLSNDAPGTRVLMVYQGPVSAPMGTRLEIPQTDPYVNPDLLRRTGRVSFSDAWTGTGEVMAVHKLTQLSADAHAQLKVVRSRVLSMDEIRDRNLIFIGSSWGNGILNKICVRETPFSCCEAMAIVNHLPKAGEPASYPLERNGATGELAASYALFSVLPGLTPGKSTVISAGLSTHGSWAAIDLLTSPTGIHELMDRLTIPESGPWPPYFQAVIRTEIVRGEPSNAAIVTARRIPITGSAGSSALASN